MIKLQDSTVEEHVNHHKMTIAGLVEDVRELNSHT